MKIYFIALFSLIIGHAYSQIEYKSLDTFLKKYVNASGEVNYKEIKSQKKVLDRIATELSAIKSTQLATKNEQLAYWINLYNVYTLKLLTDNYPLKSIQNLDGGKPWDVVRIKAGGKKYSLNQIENDIIRAKYKEPRIHFAVNCGAYSCPSLLNEAYTSAKLSTQLERQTNKFVNNKIFNTLVKDEVKISKIFDWYAVDFGPIVGFLNKYSSVKIDTNAKVSFVDYDWRLNGK